MLNKYNNNRVGKLPKVRIKDSIKEKSCFVDHNRRSYMKCSLDDVDLHWLDKRGHKNKTGETNGV